MAEIDNIINEQDFSVKLVEALKKHPCLYNYKLPEYSKKDVTEKAWEAVAQEVHETVSVCKAKWKNIRTVFVRKIKPVLSGTAPTSGKTKRPYYLNKEMKFLLPYLKPVINGPINTQSLTVSLQTNDTLQDVDDDNSGDPNIYTQGTEQDVLDIQEERLAKPIAAPETTHQIFTSRGFKRKAETLEVDTPFIEFSSYRANNKNDDFKKMFLLSLLPELHLMDDQQMRQFKRRVLHLIDDILDQRPPSALSASSSFNTEAETFGESSQRTNIKYELKDDYQV